MPAMNIKQATLIPSAQAIQCSKQLAQQEGIFVGISAGASFAAALEVAKDAAKGTTIGPAGCLGLPEGLPQSSRAVRKFDNRIGYVGRRRFRA